MKFVILGFDGPDGEAKRKIHRPAHLARLEPLDAQGRVVLAGPLTDRAGSLIVIEGTDGVGRSTQVDQLIPWLEVQGEAVTNTGWTRSPLLEDTINDAKAGHELTVTTFSLLYAADFADRLENEIIPALRAGFIVVADRYMYTAFARNTVMGADRRWTRDLFGFAVTQAQLISVLCIAAGIAGMVWLSRPASAVTHPPV